MTNQDPQVPSILKNIPNSRRKLGIVVAVVLGLAALASVLILNNRSASPEEALLKMGYKKTDADFMRAITDKQTEAVGLFCKAKMRLKPEGVHVVFDDLTYDTATVAALMDGACMGMNVCPVALTDMPFYLKAAAHPDKRKDLRKLCGQAPVIRAIEQNIASGRQALLDNAAANEQRPERINSCVHAYLSEGTTFLMEQAARFKPRSANAYTQRQCVLARLNLFLVAGNRADFRQAVQAAATECCTRYEPVKPQSTELVDGAVLALDVLR
jgi:hypothetical protein